MGWVRLGCTVGVWVLLGNLVSGFGGWYLRIWSLAMVSSLLCGRVPRYRVLVLWVCVACGWDFVGGLGMEFPVGFCFGCTCVVEVCLVGVPCFWELRVGLV